MVRMLRGMAAPLSALALLALFAGRGDAQYYYAAPAPVVSYYYTPSYYAPRVAYAAPAAYYAPVTSYYAPATSYYAAPVSYYAPTTAYYAPATSYYAPGAATTYRYGLFGRRSVTYYTPPVYYGY